MPRPARLDAPGALHHVMGRSLAGSQPFQTEADREDFLQRVAALCTAGALAVYAWALLPNHFHLLLRTGRQPAAVRAMGYSGAEVARFLGVTISSVKGLAVSEQLPEVRRYLNAL